MLAIQPHYDDALFSAGATLASMRTEVADILTIYSGFPTPPLQTHYDVNCGFTSSEQAMFDRRLENARAAAVLGLVAQLREGELLDQQYGGASDEHSAAEIIRHYAGPAVHMLAPLGILHSDHVACADAAVRCFKNVLGSSVRLWLYEDLPYRVLHPEFTLERIAGLRESGLRLDLMASRYTAEDLAWKRAAIACYRSQLDDPSPPELLVPERLWEVSR